MFVYIACWLVLLVDNFFTKRNKKSYNKMFFTWFFLFFITSFRYNIGWDYMAYYNTIRYDMVTNIMSRQEYLTIFLVNISKVFNSPTLYFSINSLISFGLLSAILYKKSPDMITSISIFLGMPLFYLNFLSITRMFTAVVIVFYTFLKFDLNDEKHKIIAGIIISSFFHKSALFSLVFLILPRKNDFKSFVYLFSSTLIFSFLMKLVVPIYFPQYTVYLRTTEVQEGTKTIYVFLILLLFINFVNYFTRNERNTLNNNDEFIINVYNFSTFFYFLNIDLGTIGHRLSLYGTFFALYLIPTALQKFKSSDRFIIKIILIFILFLMFLFTLKIGKDTYIPYKSIFR